ncbi:MAG: hypothetical protein E5V89_27070 [Mesorhizobium sp.]|nr:MAG: hypothetical protein EOS79_08525 [Mesorhizobium sp.]TIV65897.1 MAG: hypothetical protein E5V89_27070 [Mesorhizobium sp.]
MACNCADDVDKMLAERNTRLTRAIVFGGRDENPNLMLRTDQIETGRGKKKASSMFLTFCPFCGVKYDREG